MSNTEPGVSGRDRVGAIPAQYADYERVVEALREILACAEDVDVLAHQRLSWIRMKASGVLAGVQSDGGAS